MKHLILLLTILITDSNPISKIHNPSRLFLLDPNKTVFGVVKKVNNEIDGDIHIRLKVNDKTLLTKNNFIKEDSCLVLEIICGSKSIFKICNGYVNNVEQPNIGDSVMVRGLFVYDKIHKINEIHPVFDIERIIK